MNDVFEENGVKFSHPFVPYDNDERLIKRMYEILQAKGIGKAEIASAVHAARKEQHAFKCDVENEGRKALAYAKEHKKKAIILAGRPYHLDTEINHGINKMITSFDMVVLSEDSICGMGNLPRPIRVLDQWVYHSRLYKAADFAGRTDGVELVQLNSFGCGVDAVTTDEVEEILEHSNKLYTVLKIDEGNNLGAIRIRIRSLKAAMEERDKNGIKAKHSEKPFERRLFTEEMRKNYTLLIPQMSPIHFQYLEVALRESGYNAVLIPTVDKHAIDEGLKYVNNDACYPTLVTLGKMISALKSGDYDLDRTALIMSQTGGGCRASNYIALLRKALKDLNMEQVPVVSFNMVGLETNPGFKIDVSMGKRLVMAADNLRRPVPKTAVCDQTLRRSSGLCGSNHEKIRGGDFPKLQGRKIKNIQETYPADCCRLRCTPAQRHQKTESRGGWRDFGKISSGCKQQYRGHHRKRGRRSRSS